MEQRNGSSNGHNLPYHNGEFYPSGLSLESPLEKSLGGLSPEQRSNLMGVAASEAVRLQVKREESQLDAELSRQKFNQATNLARSLNGERFISYRIETEHAGTRLTVQRGCFALALLLLAPVFTLVAIGWSCV